MLMSFNTLLADKQHDFSRITVSLRQLYNTTSVPVGKFFGSCNPTRYKQGTARPDMRPNITAQHVQPTLKHALDMMHPNWWWWHICHLLCRLLKALQHQHDINPVQHTQPD